MSCYLVIIVLMLVSRIAEFRDSGECVIGLHARATIPLLAFDLYLNCFLTGMFLYPLYSSKVVNPTLRRVARRTLIAATASLVTSAVNMLILTIMHGKQLGWVCLASCGADVTLNAVAVFWVTDNRNGGEQSIPPPPVGHPEVLGLSSKSIDPRHSRVVGMNTIAREMFDDHPRQPPSIAPFEYPPAPLEKVSFVATSPNAKNPKPEKKKRSFDILKRVGHAVSRNRVDEEDFDAQLSVQVTVTREYGLEDDGDQRVQQDDYGTSTVDTDIQDKKL